MRNSRNSWTPERVLIELKSYAAEGYELNSRAMGQGFLPLAGAARRFFGSVREAIKVAGLEYAEPEKHVVGYKWRPDTIMAELREIAGPGQSLSSIQIKRRNGGLYHAARREYGSTCAAVEAAGLIFERRRRGPYDRRTKPVRVVIEAPKKKVKVSEAAPAPAHQAGGITYPAFEQMFDQRRKDNGRELSRIVSPLSMGEAQRVGR